MTASATTIPGAAAAVRPDPKTAVRLLEQFFLNRTDVLATRMRWGKPAPQAVGEKSAAFLLAHVAGEKAPTVHISYKNKDGGTTVESGRFRCGAYAPAPDGTTKWLCYDFDGGAEHAASLADPLAAALATMKALSGAGLPSHLERSGGGQGWHVWVLFAAPVPAAHARAIGHAFAPKDAPLVTGGVADSKAGQGIEVFPKQNKIAKGKYGNLVYLPWWSAAPDGANLFYRVLADGRVEPFVPESFETAAVEAVDKLVATFTVEQPKATSVEGHDRWAEWRKAALAALPLESVYGGLLTGVVKEGGWHEARDPSSPTGDQNPSAGVANGTGDAERGTFHSFISGESLSVFDFLMKRGDVADFKAACARIAELSGVPLPAGAADAAVDPATGLPPRRRPQVIVRQALAAVTDAAEAALARCEDSGLYGRAGMLVRIVRSAGKKSAKENEKKKKGEVHRPAGAPVIEVASAAHVRERLDRAAEFVTLHETDQGTVKRPSLPPTWVVDTLMARGAWPLAHLEGIVESPTLREDGTILDAPGYDEAAGLLYEPSAEFPKVPEHPTPTDVEAALALLLDPFTDFPFVAPSDRAAAVAALLTVVARTAIYGPAPMIAVRAPTPGTGKSMVVDIVAIVATGRPAARMTIGRDDQETRKLILSIGLEGGGITLIDNVEGALGSPALAAALTSMTFRDRLLGQSRVVAVSLRTTTWFTTGNGLVFKGDLGRRVLPIDLDAGVEHPEDRDGFKHTDVLAFALAERPRLVAAALTVLRAYHVAGRPAHGRPRVGSFEAWDDLVRGACVWSGVGDPVEGRERIREESDADLDALRDALVAWRDAFGSTAVTIVKALERAAADAELRVALTALVTHATEKLDVRSVGYALRRLKGRVVDGLRFQYAGRTGGKVRWCVIGEDDRGAASKDAADVHVHDGDERDADADHRGDAAEPDGIRVGGGSCCVA